MSVINQYNLYFNTNYRNSSTVDYPMFNLVKPISLSSSNNFFEIALTSASIPFAWYILRSPDTTIYYKVNAGSTVSTSIPAGIYNITALLSLLQTTFNSLSLGSSFTFTFDRNTQYATFSMAGALNTFTIFFSTNKLLCKILGFQEDLIITSSTPAISKQQVNCSPIRNVYFRCDNLAMTNNFESVGTVNLQSDIIEIIPITTNINSYILFNPSNLNYNRINNNVISNLSIYISDDESAYNDSVPILLNWSFSIRIREIRPEYLNGMKDTLPQPIITNNNIDDKLNEEKLKIQDLKEKLNKQIEEIRLKKNQNKNLE